MTDSGIEYEDLSVDVLDASPSYQRLLDQKAVDKIVKDFEQRQFGTIVVAWRTDGSFVVIDGQHRVKAMMEIDPTRMLRCEVHTGLTYEEEAALFVKLQKNRKPMSQADQFHASVHAGNPRMIRIKEIVESTGLKVSRRRTNGPGEISAVGFLDQLYGNDPTGRLLFDTLTIIRDAWGLDSHPNKWHLQAIASFLRRNRNTTFDRKRVVRILTETGEARFKAMVVAESASAGVDIGNAGGRLITRSYNKNLRMNHLEPWVDFTKASQGVVENGDG